MKAIHSLLHNYLFINNYIVTVEREQAINHIIFDKDPTKQSYEIGSRVTLNCSVNARDRSVTSYRLSSARYGTSYSSTNTLTIRTYSLNSVEYYCQAFRNGRLLNVQNTRLHVKGILFLANMHKLLLHYLM